jgi:hypothetical protein
MGRWLNFGHFLAQNHTRSSGTPPYYHLAQLFYYANILAQGPALVKIFVKI